MNRYTILFLFFACLLAITACKPSELNISKTPEIELLDVGPLAVQAFVDSISFQIGYTDGDGDLGTNDDTERNVFIIDNRIEATHAFRLQQLAPDGAEIPIRGSFRVSLPNTIITDGSTQQTVNFTIYVVDRKGRESNQIVTPDIIVSE